VTDLLWLIPALPFAGFLILALAGTRLSKTTAAWIGSGTVGISALLTIVIGIQFIMLPEPHEALRQALWTWMQVGGFRPGIAFYLDALTLVFVFVITFVGFLIHLYSAEFMEEDTGFSRFFAYMNLFVGSMLVLVMADNLLLMYLGWEGVGLCSYLLIGFWYSDPANGYAARKAFVMTRVGDTALAVGLFLLFSTFGTLNIQSVLAGATEQWAVGSNLAVITAALLLGGAVGKSAQLPLQTWLPDAMAGPTPVSALIHAATMVTAGVYLIARTHVLFSLAPVVQTAVAVIGAATLLMAGFAALTQVDIKRVLAYSTISQIGYMFLALGVGAWSAAVFHFMIHAFFKALLFLGAGAIIITLHHEHNMFKMGGLRRSLPGVFRTFVIGSASLAAVPLITAGFYSKDDILWYAWSSAQGSIWLWLAGLTGAFITGLYTFRMVFITFYGEAKAEPSHHPGWRLLIPLTVLAVLSLIGGFVEVPKTLGNITLFSDFMESALPPVRSLHESAGGEIIIQLMSAAAALAGIYIAYLQFIKNSGLKKFIDRSHAVNTLKNFWFSGWGFDQLYDRVFVDPLVRAAQINKNDFIDRIYTGIAAVTVLLNRVVGRTQSGRLRWYAVGFALGAVITLTIVVLV
jgi:NADH-quinone oxidoreductase subunit L